MGGGNEGLAALKDDDLLLLSEFPNLGISASSFALKQVIIVGL